MGLGRGGGGYRTPALPLLLLAPAPSALAQQLFGATVTEATLTLLLGLMALSLSIVLVLYRRQRRLTELLRQESRTDHLTHIPNRRYFFEVLEGHVAQAVRHSQPLCLLVLDLDHFKTINDTHGHAVGDQVLIRIAAALQAELRKSDTVGRLGGEEFGVQLPMTSLEGGAVIAERLRQRVASLDFSGLREGLRVSGSFGLAVCEPDMSVDALYQAADDALYQAKEAGRNRIVLAHRQLPRTRPACAASF